VFDVRLEQPAVYICIGLEIAFDPEQRMRR
jgi:hypothetical protein